MRVEFHGAARTVTGSCTLLEAAGTRLLVDCGQFQGDDDLERLNSARFRFHPPGIDALVLTHAHIDHVGRAPLLVRQGFRGRVLCTRATAALVGIMWRDTVKIAEEDARRGGPPAPYGEAEVRELEKRIETLHYGEEWRVGAGARVTLSDAGHILGSAHAAVHLEEDGRLLLFGVSGDVGCKGRPVVADPTPFPQADCVQVESTYGDRDHRSGEATVEELLGILESALQERGVVLVPAFALGRTQDLLYHVNAWKSAGRLKDLAVYVDSPLAIRITQVFRNQPGAMDDDVKALLARGDDPFTFAGLRFVTDHQESEKLAHEVRGALIISSSGMCQGGRIRGHLATLLPRASTQVVFVGYQAPGTLGRRLVDRAKSVRLGGREVPVNARIHTLGGFSAHAGRRELLDWLKAIGEGPRRVFLCHGEDRALEAFAASIRSELGFETVIPDMGQSFTL
jgi:metallo-beta-lactamase family protein